MTSRKGFTLVELMVVVLIVGILAAVAIPLMQGRIDSAKWSEGRAGIGTIASSLRAYTAENATFAGLTEADLTDIGVAATDLNGTYFITGDYTFTASAAAGVPTFAITATASAVSRAAAPTNPGTMTLTVTAGGAAVWS